MSQNVFDKFTNNYKKTLKNAAVLALELNHPLIEPEHLLYGLINQGGSVGAELFASREAKAEAIKNMIAKNIRTEAISGAPNFSEKSKRVIQKSIQIAYANKHKYIGTEHLLSALVQSADEIVKKLLHDLKIPQPDLSQQVNSSLKSASKLPEITENFRTLTKKIEEEEDEDEEGIIPSILDVLGTNLTAEKWQKNIDPVIGREDEITRIIQILSRRSKNNPLILGEPGVGKTAIVEGLAKRISQGKVPGILKDKKIYSLDLANTIAGTMFRGEFENRLKQIIDEVKKNPNIILFIDEIHNIVGAGAASGSMDAANILKPALARGEIHCIGATTYADYRKSIENDPALERRFQPVRIEEPDYESAVKILLGLKKNYEEFHGVAIDNEAIEAAVRLSQRYLPEKFLPDKAIDLIDEASSAAKIGKKISAREKNISKLKADLDRLEKEKRKAILNEKYSEALAAKQDFFKVTELLEKETKAFYAERMKNLPVIGAKEIAKIISKMSGIPIGDLTASEQKSLSVLDKKIMTKIIGQNEAVKEITDYLKRAKAGLTPENKPLASLLLLGPSGVGKTFLAKVLAENMFKDEKALIRIDMSEYGEKFNVSKLIGAPAGYVGYKESGLLTEKVKHKPYSIILLDEVEKANRDVFDLLLQVLDEGFLTDAAGARINFQNTVIIMTSNLGSRKIGSDNKIGFNEDKTSLLEDRIMAEAKDYFKTEFLNRLDKIIFFKPLKEADLVKITKAESEKLAKRLIKKRIKITFSLSALKLIAKKSRELGQGARGINKSITDLIETPLSQMILEEKITAGKNVSISEKNGIINLDVKP